MCVLVRELTIANNYLLMELGSGPIARASAGGEGAGNQGAGNQGAGNQGAVGGSSLGESAMITAALQDSANIVQAVRATED